MVPWILSAEMCLLALLSMKPIAGSGVSWKTHPCSPCVSLLASSRYLQAHHTDISCLLSCSEVPHSARVLYMEHLTQGSRFYYVGQAPNVRFQHLPKSSFGSSPYFFHGNLFMLLILIFHYLPKGTLQTILLLQER